MKNSIFILVFILVFVLAIRLFFYHQERIFYREGDDFKVTHSMSHEPKKNSYGQYFYIGNVMVSVPMYPKYNYGDTIIVNGKVSSIASDKGKILTVKNPEINKTMSFTPMLWIGKFARDKVSDAVFKTIPGREGGLLIGIILGVRDKIDSGFYKDLKDAGVLHVIAASGQNVSILASLLLVSFERFVKRRQALLFTGLIILVYSGITGFDPPIVRASIMALITFGALAFGKQNTGLLALFITGWGMVVYDPSILQSISFQLSFLSTLGIMTIKPILDNIIKFKMINIIKDDITTTFSAQIATLPLLLTVFGSYSLISLPVNILVLWTIPFLMVFGGIGALLALLSPAIATPFILLAYPFLVFFTFIIDASQKLYLGFDIDSIPVMIVIGYYLILIAIVNKLNAKKRGAF